MNPSAAMYWLERYRNCTLCPRRCGVDRLARDPGSSTGPCGETDRLRVAHVGPHFGEEPPISGWHGSGTVFFTGCSLRCSFCQNYQISHNGLGTEIGLGELGTRVMEMVRRDRVHNLNLVTPDHFFPHVFELVSLVRRRGIDLPFVYNLSGYQSGESLRRAEDYADIYLPDFKYSDPALAARLSSCGDYPGVALGAIAKMVRQKGFLDSTSTGAPLATRGVLVRHLILPGRITNSINALTALFVEFGPSLPLSLMSQYHPVVHHGDRGLNRRVSETEFDTVYSHALELGFESLFVQFPEDRSRGAAFLPDFQRPEPFGARSPAHAHVESG